MSWSAASRAASRPAKSVVRLEAPRGEVYYFVKGNGSDKPERLKVRTPTICNLTSVIRLAVGHQLADVPMILAGIDPCFSCNDRMVQVRDVRTGQPENDDLGTIAPARHRLLSELRKMNVFLGISSLLVFPGGLFLVVGGLLYEWADHKMLALLQNRVGPRWFQPFADTLKLLMKEEIIPDGVNPIMFIGLPLVALAGALTAGLYVPLAGLPPTFGFPGDLIVVLYLLSLLTLGIGLAGANSLDRFSLIGATRTLTQVFSYEAPFLLALLGPAMVAGSWQIGKITAYAASHWLILTQPLGFLVALIGLMGKLELAPFDAPEAHTEIVAGAMTEYSGRGLAIFNLGRAVELVIGLTLVSAFYLGGLSNPLWFLGKTLLLLLALVGIQSLLTRLRIDQTVGLWWRYGVLLVLFQWLIVILFRGL